MTKTRPDKIKLEIVAPPAGVHFSEFVGRKDSVYVSKLTEAIAKGQSIKILIVDKYMLMQFRNAAKKLNIRLVFGTQGEDLYIKPVETSVEEKRLLLVLREPRTENELASKNFELHLKNSLSKLASEGVAHLFKGKWVLTEKGLDQL